MIYFSSLLVYIAFFLPYRNRNNAKKTQLLMKLPELIFLEDTFNNWKSLLSVNKSNIPRDICNSQKSRINNQNTLQRLVFKISSSDCHKAGQHIKNELLNKLRLLFDCMYLKKCIVPFYGLNSLKAAYNYVQMVGYFGSQLKLVLILSTSEGWKIDYKFVPSTNLNPQ